MQIKFLYTRGQAEKMQTANMTLNKTALDWYWMDQNWPGSGPGPELDNIIWYASNYMKNFGYKIAICMKNCMRYLWLHASRFCMIVIGIWTILNKRRTGNWKILSEKIAT